MYSFAQREDTTVVDEPLYAHYLRHQQTDAAHPGQDEIMASQSSEGATVVRDVLLGKYATPLVVFKQMTHHLIELDRGFLSRMEHILLIRDPRAIITSYAKVIPNPTMDDIGVRMQYELCQELEASGRLTAVLDTEQLLRNPRQVLRVLCEEKLGVPFTEAMLHWPAGPRVEDGVWAKYWYHSVHLSTGFQSWQPKTYALSPPLTQLAQACEPYYDYLFERAIRAEG
ncbi:MAG: hypothetical protein KDC54_03240 [Lewinella sp.]|nr:hypothetical protein [Lewinella sp.]